MGATNLAESAKLAPMRAAAVDRRRRLIYNNDGDDLLHSEVSTVEDFLAARSIPLLETQVDTVCYGSGVTTLFHHLTKVAETYLDLASDVGYRGSFQRHMTRLRALGGDSLSFTIDFCRQHDLEVFWSHRMNDVHDARRDPEVADGSGFCLAPWKLNHPRFLMGTPESQAVCGGIESPHYFWSAFDFDHREVLDYLCRIQQEICDRYDVDGIELDYHRNPLFFRPNLEKEPATAAQVDLMTGLQRRLRRLHLRAGERRGRPLLTAIRVPSSERLCLHVGIDIRTWLAEGLLDLLIPGAGYLPFTEPVAELVELAHQHAVPAYPSVNTPLLTRRPGGKVEALRGAAANLFAAGADGLHLFNCFDNNYEKAYAIDIGAPETLEGQDKVFLIDRGTWTKGGYDQAMEQGQGLPKTIPCDGAELRVQLPIGDDIAAAAGQGRLASAELMIRVDDSQAVAALSVRLNGELVTVESEDPEKREVRFKTSGFGYIQGMNEIAVRVGNGAQVNLVAVEVAVKYGQT